MSRRSASAPEEDPPGSQQFMFIDSSADRGRAGEAVRVHVMRQSHRNRREQQGQLRRTHTQDEMMIFDRDVSVARTETSSSGPVSPIPAPATEGMEVTYPSSSPLLDWVSVVRSGLSGIPHRSIGELEGLADSYVSNVRLLQGDVLRLCRGDVLAMSSFLSLAAFQHCLGPIESNNMASARFEAGALESLRARVARPETRPSTATMLAMLLLSRVEELKGSTVSALHHRNALQNFVRSRGGLEAVAMENQDLFRILRDTGFNDMDELARRPSQS